MIDRDIMISEIIRISKIHPSRVFNIFLFGSRVYGTASDKSDYDIIMVANNSVESTEIKHPIYNIHIYTPDKFKEDLDWHRINNIECILAPEWAKLKEDIKYELSIDSNKLRHSISHISSNSWVKSKKKLTIGDIDEYQVGVKSLFHSIRIPMFASHIIKYGNIDYSCANYIWDQINSRKWTWDELDNKYRVLYNITMSKFREDNGLTSFIHKRKRVK